MKIAFVGAGRVVSWQLERIAKTNKLEIGGLYDVDQQVRDAYARDGYKTFESLSDLCNSNPDVISICTPSDQHLKAFDEVTKLCGRGQIITIEKPTFLKLSDFDQAKQIILEKGLNVFPVFQNRYNDVVQHAKKIIRNQTQGKFLHAKINLSWCRPQRYYDLASWRGMWASDGGSLTNQGIHFIDLARYLCGEIRDVSFRMDRADVSIECENVAVGSMRTENGRIISVDINTVSRPDDHNAEITLYSSEGFISLGGIAANKINEYTGNKEDISNEEFPNAYGFGHEKFFLAIEEFFSKGNKENVLSSLDDAESTLKVLHAAYSSAANSALIKSTNGPFDEILGYAPKPIKFN